MGSGFMAHAIESLKRNRRLLHEKTNRFRQRQVTSRSHRTTNRKNNSANTWKLKLADKKRRNSMLMQVGLIAFFSILGTTVLLQVGNKFISNQLKSYRATIRSIELSTSNPIQKERYFTLIKWGNYHLHNQEWKAAQNNFNNALTLFPNGKIANLGLTKSLIYRCKHEQKYCKEAADYFHILDKSGIYSAATIDNLAILIQY